MLRLAYVSFDRVPAPKGAATHIESFVRYLGRAFGHVDLVTVAEGAEPVEDVRRWPGVRHIELPATGATLIDRALGFRRYLSRWLAAREFDAIHFRSIFEGKPIVAARKGARLIFEVNGLHSIELKYHYPRCADDRELMNKFVSQERDCLQAADHILTPSVVTAGFLSRERGADTGKITVIPNGVDVEVFAPQIRGSVNGAKSLLYFGTLAAWQGVELAIRALPKIREKVDASLTILGTGTRRRRHTLHRLAEKLGVNAHVEVGEGVPQHELALRMSGCDAVLAPLLWNDRNVVQGCCPLKVLESMAAGKAVLSSDMPVMRELGCHERHFWLVKPGAVDALAEGAIRLLQDTELAGRIGAAAREHVERYYSWERAGADLLKVYEAAGVRRSSTD